MYAVGYNDIRTTPRETVIFPVVMLLSNALIYYFIFYILTGLLSLLLDRIYSRDDFHSKRLI